MGVSRRYRELTCLACAGAAAVIAFVARGPIGADGPLLDLLVKSRSVIFPAQDAPEKSPAAVIAVDQRSLNEPELARYPRTFLAPVWATVMDGVFQAGARAVGFDLLFSFSANQFSPGFEAPFLAALDKYRDRVVLARSATTLPAPPFLAALRNDEGALGLAELPADPDGKYRRVQASYETVSDGAVMSLAGALLRRAQTPAMPPEVLLAPRRHLETIPTYALIDVLRCAKPALEALRQAFGGKIVLIGTTLPEEDRRQSSGRFLSPPRTDAPPLHSCGLRRLGASAPDSASVPGVFLHAAAVEAVVSGRVPARASTGIIAAMAAVTATVGVILGLCLGPWVAGLTITGIAVVLFGSATAALAGDLWIPLALPLGALVAGPVIAYVVRYVAEERTRRRIQHAFSHYLSPVIVERLATDASALKLGGELREVTVMFADLSGFTALSGKVSAEELMRLTNRYLAYIVEQVEATGGYVDKFIGDAVMAIWGAPANDPHHAVNGVRAAMAAVAKIREEQQKAKESGEVGFSVKIGLNSGPAVVGNVGTDKRYNYTAVGETVNLASRLEGVPGLYGCQIVVGPRTAEQVQGDFLFRELDTIKVKGGDAPLPVFEPIAERAQATAEQIDRVQRFAEALAHYRAMRFAEASPIWDALARSQQESATNPGHEKEVVANPASKMAERARALATNPPASPWDAVWVLTSK